MSAKNKLLSYFRIIVQIVCLVILPALYASTFSGIKTLFNGMLDNSLTFEVAFPIALQVFSTIILTALAGRFFCGWMCSFGAVSDWIYGIANKLFKIKYRLPEKVNTLLNYFKYLYLFVLVLVLWRIDFAFLDVANPWNAFSSIFTLNGLPDFASAFKFYTFGTLLLVAILIASMFIERFFCRYLCPLGAIFAVVSKIKILRIKKNSVNCGACKVCTNNCPMGIPMYKYDKISSGECIMCMRCTQVCPRRNAALSVAETNLNTAVASTVAVASIATTMYCTSNNLFFTPQNTADTAPAYSSTIENKYKDGTYEGSGIGFHRGTTTVSVTVVNDKISDIEVVSYEDDRPYFSIAYNTICSEIIESQNTDVDIVSGATYSSIGIIDAVEDALSNAKNIETYN